jgi:ribose transport system ATP-binding protein
MELLECRNISKSFFGIQVLFNVNMQLRAGEIHCLVGENGAGKSTLIKILTGVYTDYTGEIFVDGVPCVMHSPLQSRMNSIFSVQQHRDLVPTMNAVENIFLGNYILQEKGFHSIDDKAEKQKAVEYLNAFRVHFDMDVMVSELKVGEQGIVAICKAMASNGKILLIDEASAPLDSFERKVLYNLLKDLRDDGKGIIYISHHLEEIFEIGDRVSVLRNGANVWTKNTSDTDRNDLIAAMTGNKKLYKKDTYSSSSVQGRPEETPIIEYKNVRNKEINDVSLKIYKGETIGFAGLEGSGKQVLAEMLFGLKNPESGTLIYKEKEVNFTHPIYAIKNDIGLIPTDRKQQGLVLCRSLAENISLPMLNKTGKVFVSRNWMTNKARESVEALRIVSSSTNQLVEYLSGGNQQKVLIAKWIQAESEVMCLIEPTEGIDVGARGDIYALLKQMANNGKTLLIFSSDIDELITLCDRIFTMSQGTIKAEYDDTTMNKVQILSDILAKHEQKGESV